VSVEPGNPDLQSRLAEVKELRAKDQPTIPTWIGQEKKTNPFLRVDVSPEIRSKCGISEGESDAHAFAKVRRAKDTF
jgi:hydroxyacylglutathione hydrolase